MCACVTNAALGTDNLPGTAAGRQYAKQAEWTSGVSLDRQSTHDGHSGWRQTLDEQIELSFCVVFKEEKER